MLKFHLLPAKFDWFQCHSHGFLDRCWDFTMSVIDFLQNPQSESHHVPGFKFLATVTTLVVIHVCIERSSFGFRSRWHFWDYILFFIFVFKSDILNHFITFNFRCAQFDTTAGLTCSGIKARLIASILPSVYRLQCHSARCIAGATPFAPLQAAHTGKALQRRSFAAVKAAISPRHWEQSPAAINA